MAGVSAGMTEEQIGELCNRLQGVGSAVIDTGAGVLAFVSSRVLDVDQDSQKILVAWEGKGAIFWRVGDKISTFQLIDAGFGLNTAKALASVLHVVGQRLSMVPSGETPLLVSRKGLEDTDEKGN